MLPQELQSDYKRLANRIRAIEIATAYEQQQIELISLSSNFICIDICGRLEQNLKSIFSSFGGRKSNNVLNKPIARLLSSYQNPKPLKLVELVGLFDEELSHWLKDNWKENSEHEIAKKRLDNLVLDRITLAHSKNVSHTVSITKLKNYHIEYMAIVSFLAHYFLSTPLFEKNKYALSRKQKGLKIIFS